MYFKRIFTPGLSHYSYMVGDKDEVAVIDPRRDIEVYIEEARVANVKITHIFETHRNEDYISGSIELGNRTGAKIYISKHEDLGHIYGEKIGDGDEFQIGDLKLKALHTPGHTVGHLSYTLYIKGDLPYMVFTGDTLFWGDLGRSDFYGKEKLSEMTGLLYESIFDKILGLGDHVMIMPAHGAGSACGGAIEERDYSTVGYEKASSPALQAESKKKFIEKHGYMRLKPPYFSKIEICNVEGAEFVGASVELNLLDIKEIGSGKSLIVDIRSQEAYAGKHIAGSIYINRESLSGYLGWLADSDEAISFLADGLGEEELCSAYWTARRMGYDNIAGVYGSKSVKKAEKYGIGVAKMEEITAEEYLNIYQSQKSLVLDVRKDEEIGDEYPYRDRISIPLQLMKDRTSEIPKDRDILIICRSGERSIVASSVLEMTGIKSRVVSGGISAIRSKLTK